MFERRVQKSCNWETTTTTTTTEKDDINNNEFHERVISEGL
jgi:hypothetical protein